MKNKKLEIYLFFCTVMFFVLMAVILFYSFGYKYNITEKKIVLTGAIIIKSEPKEIDIYIDDKKFKKTAALVNLFSDYIKIEELDSGIHNVKIKKEGYFDWEKNIEIKGTYVTELKNVVLLKEKYDENILSNDIYSENNAENIWHNNKKDKVIYKKKIDGKLSFFLFDLKNKNEEKIIDTETLIEKKSGANYALKNVIWSADDSRIILEITDRLKNDSLYFLVKLDNKSKIYNITSVFEKRVKLEKDINFNFNDALFFTKKNQLYKFDYEKLSSVKILENVSSFTIQGNHLYYFGLNDSSLYSANLNDLSDQIKIFTMSDNFDSSKKSQIVISGKGTYIILNADGRLYFIDEKNDINNVNVSVEKAYFSDNFERILYSNSNEIWIFYIKEKISQPSKKESTNDLVTRYSGNISNIFTYKDNEHLFFKEGNNFKFVEIDNRDKLNAFELMKIENGDIFYSENLNSLIYIKNNQLSKVGLD